MRLARTAPLTPVPRVRLALLPLLAAALLSCSSGDGAPAHPGEARDVAVRVDGVGVDVNDMPVLLLEERDGSRWLPIWIGSAEAGSIVRQIEEIESPRPDTHDLARSMIDGLHGEVERVVVTDLRGGTYYAVITLRADGRRIEIDSRPSDAIAIALRTGSPIFVREGLFSEGSRLPLPPSDDAPSI